MGTTHEENPETDNALAKRLSSLPDSHTESAPLLDYALRRGVKLPRGYRQQRAFFRHLRRVASDSEFRVMLNRLRDAVIRSALKDKGRTSGLAVAVTGVKGGEGASLVSFLLALALGTSSHYRVAFLDGHFSARRFEILKRLFQLSENSCRLNKGSSRLSGYYNELQPNVYFLKSPAAEHSLQFFSDKRLTGFIEQLRQDFDFAVISMPPLLKESSNVFLAPAVDRLYVVSAAGKTRLLDVDRCLEVAEEAGVNISGMIINYQKAPLWSRLFWRDYFF